MSVGLDTTREHKFLVQNWSTESIMANQYIAVCHWSLGLDVYFISTSHPSLSLFLSPTLCGIIHWCYIVGEVQTVGRLFNLWECWYLCTARRASARDKHTTQSHVEHWIAAIYDQVASNLSWKHSYSASHHHCSLCDKCTAVSFEYIVSVLRSMTMAKS